MGEPLSKQRVVLDDKTQVRWDSKVKKTDSCWYWTGGLTPKGYANFRVGADYVERAHVLAYLMAKGEVPAGMQVRHICPGDRHYKHCVNPDHLSLGTAKQNGEDKAVVGSFKGVLSGEKNPRVKLTDEQVIEIHRRIHAGEDRCDLAVEFNVTPQQIGLIRDGRIRKYLKLPEAPLELRGPNTKKREIRRGLSTPPEQDEIDRFNVKFTKSDGCWLWTAATDKAADGDKLIYGQFSFRGRNVGAHVFAYMLAYGAVPPNHDVAHSCANTLCVRPDHLTVETRRRNMDNTITRSRLSQSKMGNRNRAVLTDDQIRQIKETYRDEPELTDQEIVDRLKLPVGPAALAKIRKGQSGAHVLVEGFEPRSKRGAARGERAGRSKLSDQQRLEIVTRRTSGESALKLADEFKISRRQIDHIVMTSRVLREGGVGATPSVGVSSP